ncbi:hypothetical protein M3P21_18585 [Ruegeria sp. 2012CJ41-6]|uniref:Uncharacterized protein n=1 Tax=Ruegeria spongiae TaxID=2942209 RepID=A0ABT0Q7Z9_9RHOB|nr:hypothetical protein [Ruegeria spongiae]MCL6285542.1 hypothetical protein [Ruegeria spongiae]
MPIELQPPSAFKKWSKGANRFVAALRTQHGAPGQKRITQNETSIRLRIARSVACGNFTDAVLDALRLRLEHVADDDIRWHGSQADLDENGDAFVRVTNDAAFLTHEAGNGGEFVLEMADLPARSFCIIDASPERVLNSIIGALKQAELIASAEREAWTGGTDGSEVESWLAETFKVIRRNPPTLGDVINGLVEAQRSGELEVIGADGALLNVWQSMQGPGGMVRSATQSVTSLRFGDDDLSVRAELPEHPADDITKRARELSSAQRTERQMTRLLNQHNEDQTKVHKLLGLLDEHARRTNELVRRAHEIASRDDLSGDEKFDELLAVFEGDETDKSQVSREAYG